MCGLVYGQPGATFIAGYGRSQFLGEIGMLKLAEDSHGFLLTGTDIPVARLDSDNMNPLFLETSRPGIFAVGDVRSGSVKRAAAAIGEGSMAVRLVFDRLQPAGIADAIELGTGSPRA